MAITDKEQGVWNVDQVYNKINEGDIWAYTGETGLWSVGSGSNGISAQNDTVNRSSPIQIPGTTWNSGAGKIAMVEYGNIASVIKTDGTLWAWGSNQNGALGQNNTTPHSSPVQIGADTTWTNIMHNGDGMFFATKTDNTLWGWGNNHADWKLLGLGDAVSQSSPTQIGTGTDWNRPNSVGYQCNVISKTDGTLWATGSPQRNVIGLNGTGSANPANNGSPIQCGGDDWIESKGSLYYMIGTQTK